jgi:TnpA family transposase
VPFEERHSIVRYWRIDPSSDYGVLNSVARHQIKPNLIHENWDDTLRLAGLLKLARRT